MIMDLSLDQALRHAIESGNAPLAKQLLAEGANPNSTTAHTTFLHTAIMLQQKQVVQVLLKAGADAQLPDAAGRYPLHLAAAEGSTAIVNALVKHGASLTQTTENGSTALDLAAGAGQAATVRALVKAGSALETTTNEGNTPLLTASSLGNRGVVQTLLNLGADVQAMNDKGQTALQLALWSLYSYRIPEWSHTVKLGRQRHHYYIRCGGMYLVEDYQPYQTATGRLLSLRDQRAVALMVWGPTAHLEYLDALATVKLLIEQGALLEQADQTGATPLHLACFIGEGRVIDRLYRAAVSLQPAPWQGRYELHQVAASQRLDGLRVFLRCYGAAHINAPDDHGWTPAHYLGDAGGPVEMAHLLGQHGADPTATTTKDSKAFATGTTAARMAFHWKDLDLAMALDDMGT